MLLIGIINRAFGLYMVGRTESSLCGLGELSRVLSFKSDSTQTRPAQTMFKTQHYPQTTYQVHYNLVDWTKTQTIHMKIGQVLATWQGTNLIQLDCQLKQFSWKQFSSIFAKLLSRRPRVSLLLINNNKKKMLIFSIFINFAMSCINRRPML